MTAQMQMRGSDSVQVSAQHSICHVMQSALESAREGRPDELAGTKLCRHALSLGLLEMDSELTDVHTWLAGSMTDSVEANVLF